MKDNKELKAITEKLEAGVKAVFESDKYMEYLKFMSKFTSYSFNNTMLIFLQNPEASLVAGYKKWQSLNRQVRKGEKAIKILAPHPHKKEIEDEDGNTKEIRWTTFRTVSVFDVAQTDGEDLPTYGVDELTGEVDNFTDLEAKLMELSPVPVEYEDIKGGAHGYFNLEEKRIAIQEGMSQQQTIKTMIHEISHAILHDRDEGEQKEADRFTREVQAESVAYTVCSTLGLDTADYSFGYVAGWSTGKDIKELTESMDIIIKTSKRIIDELAA